MLSVSTGMVVTTVTTTTSGLPMRAVGITLIYGFEPSKMQRLATTKETKLIVIL